MKTIKLIYLLPVLALTVACTTEKKENNKDQTPEEKRADFTEPTVEQRIKRGETLVAKLGCNDCHSPKIMTDHGPAPDPERLLSGHSSEEKLPEYDKNTAKNYVLFNMNSTAAIGPWGTSFAGNLTPDETGIGNWSKEQFFKAMREGKFKGMEGTRMLLPPMPWPGYSHMEDEELEDIFLYLKSVKPVYNVVPAPLAPGQ